MAVLYTLNTLTPTADFASPVLEYVESVIEVDFQFQASGANIERKVQDPFPRHLVLEQGTVGYADPDFVTGYTVSGGTVYILPDWVDNYSLLLHEVSHILGMGHTLQGDSAMWPYFSTPEEEVNVVYSNKDKLDLWAGYRVSSSYTQAITGDSSANVINGSNRAGAGADTINGAGGNDTILGNIGNDSLLGGDALDELHGGKGQDTVFGGNGNDFIFGEIGNDVLNGGAVVDRFVFSEGTLVDTLQDFQTGTDKIEVKSSLGFTTFVHLDPYIFTFGTGTKIDFGGGDQLVLTNVAENLLDATDFIFS